MTTLYLFTTYTSNIHSYIFQISSINIMLYPLYTEKMGITEQIYRSMRF